MRLSLTVLGLLGATTAIAAGGCAASNDSESQAGAPPAYASAEPEAYDQNGAPIAPLGPRNDGVDPDPTVPQASSPAPAPNPVRTAPREPPTPPAHVDELFRTPGGNAASPPSPPPLASPTSVQTTKPAPPPPPPPPHRPRPWGGNDPCPPCGMG